MMELDGKPVEAADLAALALCNYGHFTSMRVDHMLVKGLSLHLDRLVDDCRNLFSIDLDRGWVRDLVRRVAAQAPSPAIVRVTVFAPNLDLGHPGGTAEPSVLVSTRAAGDLNLPPLRLTCVQYDRDQPHIKHTGLFGTVYHRRVAQQAGFDDVVFVDRNSLVLEGATWNVGFVDEQRVVWPHSECLPGVTMRLLKQVLLDTGIPSTEATLDMSRVADMQGAFVTNAAVGVRPLHSIDALEFPGQESMLTRLRELYAAIPGEAI